jgi:uncharacterized membrane protein YciS (DUF1049 family)
MGEFIQQYGAFILGVIFGLGFKLSWLIQSKPGVKIFISIDGDVIR